LLNAFDVRLVDVHLATQLAFTLTRLLGQDMTPKGLAALEAVGAAA